MRNSVLPTLFVTAFTVSAYAAGPEGRFEKSLSVSGPVELDVSTDAGGIIITAGTSSTVQIRGILKGQMNPLPMPGVEQRIRALEQNPPIEQRGNVIRVGHVPDHDMLKGVAMRIEIQTPVDTKVIARADSGGIRVTGVKGPVDVQTDSGGLEARQIGSNVTASADSGGIRISDVQGSVNAQADSGGIEVMNVAGAVEAQADSGGIRVAQTVAAPVRIRADSGGARVKLAPGGYDVSAESSSGSVTVPEMTVRGAMSRHRAEGKVRGGGPLVDVKVDSGTVVIE